MTYSLNQRQAPNVFPNVQPPETGLPDLDVERVDGRAGYVREPGDPRILVVDRTLWKLKIVFVEEGRSRSGDDWERRRHNFFFSLRYSFCWRIGRKEGGGG